MQLHVDRVVTEVMPEPEAAGAMSESAPFTPWEEAERLRATFALLQYDRFRTLAEGFDG
jgi:hypothetical protein